VAWCLLPALKNAFLEAIKDGRLAPEKLMDMTSEERRAAFAEILGPENAREVNAQFEAKLLLKDQQRGLVSWAKKIGGLTEPARRDLLAQISKLDKVLQPEDEKAFLEDLAAKKLGVTVTAQEAKEVFDLAQKAEQLRAQVTAPGDSKYGTAYTEELGTQYGVAVQKLLDKINSMKPHGKTFQHAALNILSLPQSALTSVFHWSAPFVQGWGMISTKEWYQGVGRMFQYFASEDAYERLNGWIIGHPNYALAVDGKLGLTKITDKLSTREEAIQSSLLQDANEWLSEKTGVPNLIKAWSRSFTGFLNYVRASRYYNLIDAARAAGEDVSLGSQNVRDLAKVVNDFTGRGDQLSLGVSKPTLNPGAATALNALFFSPRKMIATVEMFNPINYAQLSPIARRAAARQLIGSLVATGAVLTLAKLGGADVDFDPRSSKFGKIGIGNETLDMTGGNDSYVRLLSRLITNQMVTAGNKTITLGQGGPGAPTRTSLVEDYIRGKLAPVASAIWTAGVGHDPIGRPFSLSQTAADEMTPIVIHSLIDVWMNSPHDAVHLIPALSAFLGVGVEDRAPPLSPGGRGVWGDPIPPYAARTSYFDDPVTKEAERVGLPLTLPPDTIRGIKLTDEQYDDYVRLSGRLAHMRLQELIGESTYQAEAPTQQLKDLIAARSGARREATEQPELAPVIQAADQAKELAHAPVGQ
jgi:hypothetical protein